MVLLDFDEDHVLGVEAACIDTYEAVHKHFVIVNSE